MCPCPEDWALVDHCAGQCDNEASHNDLCEPLALLEPTPTEVTASLKEMVEPIMYSLSHLDRLMHPSMTKVWGRV